MPTICGFLFKFRECLFAGFIYIRAGQLLLSNLYKYLSFYLSIYWYKGILEAACVNKAEYLSNAIHWLQSAQGIDPVTKIIYFILDTPTS